MVASRAVPTRSSTLLAALAALPLLACERPAPPAAASPAGPSAGDTASAPASRPSPPAGPAGPTGAPQPPPPATPGATGGPAGGPTVGSTTAGGARLAAPVDAPPVEVAEALALIPGAATPLRGGEQVTVDPAATFRVVLRGAYPEARLSLLDGGDAMVAGAGAREVGTQTTVTFQPAAPLKPASSYRLRVDGATTRELKDAAGAARAPVEFPLLAAGEPPPEPKASRKRTKKRT